MYVAGRAKRQSTLKLEREITELQQRAVATTGSTFRFDFFPDLRIEELPLELARQRPDVLHISAHGERDNLALANQSGQEVRLSAEVLRAFLDQEQPPRIVYLNACDSAEIARELVSIAPIAIGTTASISNDAAIASAVLFYERLLNGATVQQAFDAGKRMIEAMHASATSSLLYKARGVHPETERIFQSTKLVARFDGFPSSKRDQFTIELGLIGCRSDTNQVIFYTDDATYIEDEDRAEEDLCVVARTNPVRGVIWSDFDWYAYGDIRIFGCGSTLSGEAYSVGSTLTAAIEAYYRYFKRVSPTDLPEKVQQALAKLRSNDGSGIRDAPGNRGATRKPPKRKRKT
jgi:hypothetical protein